MESVREKWTDERLDDLNGKVDDLGRRMDLRFDAMERRFESIDRRFERMDQRFDRMQWLMVTGFLTNAGLIAALAGVIVGQG
jgi:hypothetical protein